MSVDYQVQREGWHYTIVENAVLEDLELNKDTRLLFVYLSKFANAEKKCWPSVKTLSKISGISERQVRYALQELEKRGYILKQVRRSDGQNLTNVYVIKYIPPKIKTTDDTAHNAGEVLHDMQGGTAHGAGEVLHDMQGGTAHGAGGVLHDMQGGTAHGAAKLDPIERDPIELKQNELKYTPEFSIFWEHYPRKIEKKAAFRCWNTRLREKVLAADMITAAKNYAEYCKKHKIETQYIKHPSTFLGRDKPYEDFVIPVVEKPKENPTIRYYRDMMVDLP